MGWRELKARIDAENTRILDEPPEEVVRVVYYRIVDTDCGTDGQIMGTWYYGLTDVRYVVAYFYQIISSAMAPEFSVDQLKYMTKWMQGGLGEFLNDCAFHKLWDFMQALFESMDEIEDRDDLLELLNSMFLYTSHLNAWIHYYFPWNIAYTYPHRTPEQVREMVKILADDKAR